ncbi:dihydrodipicolinate synthase family protein [Verrucomicrobiales bacterium]|nr:dihydrodipicolinate synthase family protein [Verrucomicrobiales bacterium]
MLTKETLTGPWAGLPVAWTQDGRFDEVVYRGDVRRCCEAGIPGIYTGGTTGEFYAIEIDEFAEISKATVNECHSHKKPAMIGCSATSTTGAVRRAKMAAQLGADAIQVALPFWMEVSDGAIVPFFQEVATAAEGLPFSIYETGRAKKTLTIEQHRAVKEAVPSYLMSKSNAGTVGATPEGCRELSKLVNVFVGEPLWKELGPCGARGGCSAMVYWNPALILDLWSSVEKKDWDTVGQLHEKIDAFHQFLGSEFGPRGFTDTAYDRLAGVALGILKTSLQCRGPYPHATTDDIETLRSWCESHFPELLTADTAK